MKKINDNYFVIKMENCVFYVLQGQKRVPWQQGRTMKILWSNWKSN